MKYVKNGQIGGLCYFTGFMAANGWHYCDGAIKTNDQYPGLSALLRDKYVCENPNCFTLPTFPPLVSENVAIMKMIRMEGGLVPTEDFDRLYFCNPEDTETAALMGSIVPFSGAVAPKNWAFCDGAIYEIATYADLFSILGIKFGGDGMHHFAIPKLDGSYIICIQGIVPEYF